METEQRIPDAIDPARLGSRRQLPARLSLRHAAPLAAFLADDRGSPYQQPPPRAGDNVSLIHAGTRIGPGARGQAERRIPPPRADATAVSGDDQLRTIPARRPKTRQEMAGYAGSTAGRALVGPSITRSTSALGKLG